MCGCTLPQIVWMMTFWGLGDVLGTNHFHTILNICWRPQSPRVLSKVTPNRQPTLWLHNLYLKVLTVHRNELHLFWAKESSYSNYLCRTSDITAVGTISNVYSFGAMWSWDSINSKTTSKWFRHGHRLNKQREWQHVIFIYGLCNKFTYNFFQLLFFF